MSMISPQPELKPVGFYCDHSDEPHDARTHHDFEHAEGKGFVFQARPETTSAFTYADRPYLKTEDRETRCDRAVPLYTAPSVASELRAAAEEIATAVPPLEAGPRTEFERGLITAFHALRRRADNLEGGAA